MGFQRRFDEKGVDIRNPIEAEQMASKTLAQVEKIEMEGPQPPQLPAH
jgi:hypothetical protein